MSLPDPRPPRRVRDPELLRQLHILWRGECVLADGGECFEERYSLHHVHRHPRDDVEANLVMLCGDGTRGHHGRIEAHDRAVSVQLYVYLVRERLDTMAYLGEKLGGVVAVREWLNSQLHAGI
jgi:hypothetical protein